MQQEFVGSGMAAVELFDMWLTLYTHALGWHTIHKKCEPVAGGKSLDAGILGLCNDD